MIGVVDRIVDAFLLEADSALVGTYSAVLYGSAARGQFIPGHSDINVMLVLEQVTPEVLRALHKTFAVWQRARQPPPLVVSRSEWNRSADAFPIEITDMKTAYRVLRGSDPLSGLRVSRPDLRRALEREFRGKLMRLRQGFAACADDPEALGRFARESVSSVLLLLRILLTLLDRPVPNDAVALISAGAQTAGFHPGALAAVAGQRANRKWRCAAEDFVGYLAAVEIAAQFIDQLPQERIA
jgi:predicted nucleotidyltransferase